MFTLEGTARGDVLLTLGNNYAIELTDGEQFVGQLESIYTLEEDTLVWFELLTDYPDHDYTGRHKGVRASRLYNIFKL